MATKKKLIVEDGDSAYWAKPKGRKKVSAAGRVKRSVKAKDSKKTDYSSKKLSDKW